jgi:hypothetical protein
MILFRWDFTDGIPNTATFARTGDATFVTFAAAVTTALYRAVDVSRPYIGARVAEGGGTL